MNVRTINWFKKGTTESLIKVNSSNQAKIFIIKHGSLVWEYDNYDLFQTGGVNELWMIENYSAHIIKANLFF